MNLNQKIVFHLSYFLEGVLKINLESFVIKKVLFYLFEKTLQENVNKAYFND